MVKEELSSFIKRYKLEAIDDEGLIKISEGAVENAEDYNLKYKHCPPYRKGLFDDTIFGSLNVCKCGATTTPGVVCPMCGSRVLTKDEASRRLGRYELTYPYISQFKIKALCDELVNFHPEFSKFVTNAKGTRVSGISGLLKSIYNAKIVYTPVLEKDINYEDLIVTDSNGNYKVTVEYYSPDLKDTSVVNFGPSALRNLAKNYSLYRNSEKSLNFILKYINQVFIILPITKRPAIIRKDAKGNPEVSLHGINTYYRAIINLDRKMFDIMNGAQTLADKLMVYYSMNRMIDFMLGSYDIVASSKESLVRNIFSGSLKRSGRANIIGASDIPADTVKIPRSMAYECLKTEVITALKEKGVKDPMNAYSNPSPETFDMFEEMVKGYCVLLLRNPTLSKTNLSAFKVKLWDEVVIGLNISSVALFNADFDGDQMAFFWITDPHAVKLALERMGPKRNWRFVTDNSFVFKFQIAMLQGLYVASQVLKYDKPIKYFTSLEKIEQAYENDEIEVDEIIDLFGKQTTYGREKISDIINVDLDTVVGKNVPISAKNVGKILAIFEKQEDGIDRHHKLMEFGGHIGTYSGNTTVSLEDIFQTNPISPKIEEIIHSDDPDSVKYRKLQEVIPSEMMTQIENLKNKNIINIIQGAGKIKKDNLPSLFGPRIEYTKENGLVVYDNSIATGFDEGAFVSHVKENREILLVKKMLTPASGYLSRQLINICNYFVYTDEPSTSTVGAVMKAKDAIGRIKLDGSKVTETGDVLVRVKSCIDTNTNKISKEELSSERETLQTYKRDDSIGTDCAFGFTEKLTQGALALKHGSPLYLPSKEVLKSVTDGRVSDIDDKFIYVELGNVKYKYVKPKKIILTDNSKGNNFSKGAVLFYLDEEVHIENKTERINVFMDSFSKTEHVKKSEIRRAHCYAPKDGVIIYDLDKNIVKIGDVELPFSQDEVYYYPEGYKVKKGDRICSGVMDMELYRPLMNNDVGWLFYLFKDQIVYILNNDSTIVEVYEIVFKGINQQGKFSIKEAARKPGKLMNKLNLGYTKEAIREFVGKEIGESFLSDLLLTDMNNEDGV